jgi:hypothetical protein
LGDTRYGVGSAFDSPALSSGVVFGPCAACFGGARVLVVGAADGAGCAFAGAARNMLALRATASVAPAKAVIGTGFVVMTFLLLDTCGRKVFAAKALPL